MKNTEENYRRNNNDIEKKWILCYENATKYHLY